MELVGENRRRHVAGLLTMPCPTGPRMTGTATLKSAAAPRPPTSPSPTFPPRAFPAQVQYSQNQKHRSRGKRENPAFQTTNRRVTVPVPMMYLTRRLPAYLRALATCALLAFAGRLSGQTNNKAPSVLAMSSTPAQLNQAVSIFAAPGPTGF